jgi:pullulanase/glycogen debranching enzyme
MSSTVSEHWGRAAFAAALLTSAAFLSACGGGGGGAPPPPPPPPPPAGLDPAIAAIANSTEFAKVLNAVPTGGGGGGGGGATSLTVHYKRLAADYTGWQMHAWGAAAPVDWNAGYYSAGTDTFGVVYNIPLAATSGAVGYLFHKGDTKDHGGADQSYTLVPGKNEIWRIEGDNATYTSNPSGASTPDITAVRVHYKRFGGDYASWGLHLWDSNGMDTSKLAAGVTIADWNNPVAFNQMPNYSASAAEVVFDIPVLNPTADTSRKTLEFIIHGASPNQGDKDGRPDNIQVSFAALTIVSQVGHVWLVQGDPTLYLTAPDTRRASTTDARAYWLNKQLIKWPKVDGSGVFKLYASATGQIVAAKDAPVTGSDSSITLDVFGGAVPSAAATRFKYVDSGVVVSVKTADLPKLNDAHRGQLMLVQEDSTGKVQNATTAQIAGALDELYAATEAVDDLGVTIKASSTQFKLWAPTAQKVMVFTYNTGSSDAVTADTMTFDPATGVWSASLTGDLSGKYYRFAVEVFVRGVGLVRNLVTDPYSISLTTDSKRSYIGNLAAASLKPADFDATAAPAKVANQVDMSIYELHVRDFSANDSTVTAANRGKYLAFTETRSNGMKHLKALADAGLTDVHLLPIFDIASIPEAGCTTPSPSGGADSETQQATVMATKDADCFNWGYDPWHYTAPEGSYASDAADGAKRIFEVRAMVNALHKAGLRVGMDVVYNHTTASGQNARAVLDRVVPGYYQRLNNSGGVETSTCCDNTATENLMMGKLMIDSVLTWATQYKIDSFRFDLMGHQPRAVMEKLAAKLKTATGHDVPLIGEGWNFGEVADGARFVQATQQSLNGSGIGTFSDRARDAIRGGSGFDSGSNLVKNQGFINGAFYDDNGSGGKSRGDLMWFGDLVKVGLAGSIRSYSITTSWDANLTLENISYNGQPAGYVVQPQEVVNYIENHDNQTLFDTNTFKLPVATTKGDRARVQMLGAALNAFSQGVAYFHAGVDTLRSKSMDRNSYNSGDWFNRLDFSYADNNFGVGAPPQGDNGDSWATIKPFLANAALKPGMADITSTRDMFRDLLKLRSSSTLFRMRTADDIKARLKFYNTGSGQNPVLIVGHLDGNGYAGAGFKEVMYFVNVDKTAQDITLDAEKTKSYVLHPVHTAAGAADARAATATYTAGTGKFTVPARTAVVFVVN